MDVAADAASASASPSLSGAKHRYPGLRSFEERDQAQFRGRKAAAEELLLRVLSVRLLLQFAPSGVGKTSLLAAGLFPRLRRHDYFPFVVRLNRPRESLVDAVRQSLAQAADEAGLVEPVISSDADNLWSLLAGTQLWSDGLLLLTPVLVFDQFEEIFTLRDAAFRADFARQVGELASGTPRHGNSPPVKFILSLREEYLGMLEEFSSSIPDLFRERLRLPPLSADEARQAMVEPAKLAGDDWLSPPFAYTEEALDLLIDFIDGVSETVKVIEPLTLQLVCVRAESIAIKRCGEAEPITLSMQDFGGMAGLERLVREYYRQVLDGLVEPAVRRRAQRMIEDGLLDPAGKRLMLEQGEIEREYHLKAPTLNALVASSLLRREPRNESVFYEISHDRLTDTIAKQRKPRLPRWVKPTLGAGALIVSIAAAASLKQLSLAKEARIARDQAEYAVGQLLSERLVSRLREVGLSDALRQILEQTTPQGRDEYASGLAAVLKLRHSADIESYRGQLNKARKLYEQALATLEALPAAGRDGSSLLLLAERARIVGSLGGLASDAGDMVQAGVRYGEAQRLWESALHAVQPARPQELLDAADAHNSYAVLQTRLGDYDGAETSALAASRLAMQVWSTAYDGRHGLAFDTNFDTGRAMQVFADSTLNLAIPRSDIGLADAAVELAREAVRLRPLSFQARKQFGTAIAGRAAIASRFGLPPAEWRVLMTGSRRQFANLRKTDPDNVRVQREEAALEMAIAEIVAICADTPTCRASIPKGALESARLSALEFTGTFRELAAANPDNRSLIADIAWGLRVQARLLAIDGDPAAPAVLGSAIALRAQSAANAGDFDIRVDRATNMVQLARLYGKVHRTAEAKAAIDLAVEQIDGMRSDVVGSSIERKSTLATAIAVLREAGLTDDADALEVKRDALRSPASGPLQESYNAAKRINDEAIRFARAIDPLNQANTDSDRTKIEALHAQAVTGYPYDAIMWSNLRIARTEVAETDVRADAAEAIAKQESALRGAVAAAWMAHLLEPTGVRLRELYESSRSLSIHLHDHGNTGPELIALTERGLADAKELSREQPDAPETLFILADANVGVGIARESQGADGWDEAFRVAFMHAERLASLEPNNADRQVWLGTWRNHLAGGLDRDNRGPEAADQRRRALASCRAALALSTTTAQREDAQSCLNDLASAGVR